MVQTVEDRARKYSLAEFDQLFDSVKNWGRWGPDDTRGTLNYILPEHVRYAASLVRKGQSISLSLPVNKVAGPDNPNPAIHYMATGHDNDIGSGSLRFATDFIGMQFHGDSHTHIDALCHIAYRGQLYNGLPATSVTTSGADVLDITEYGHGVVGRGVLLDIPRLRGVPWLEPGTAVTRAELEAAERAEGVRLGPGDLFVYRTGHHRRRLAVGPGTMVTAEKGRPACTSTPSRCCTTGTSRVSFPTATGKPCRAQWRGLLTRSTHCRSRRWGCWRRTASTWRSWPRRARKSSGGSSWSSLLLCESPKPLVLRSTP